MEIRARVHRQIWPSLRVINQRVGLGERSLLSLRFEFLQLSNKAGNEAARALNTGCTAVCYFPVELHRVGGERGTEDELQKANETVTVGRSAPYRPHPYRCSLIESNLFC